jgi:hypothetical protein
LQKERGKRGEVELSNYKIHYKDLGRKTAAIPDFSGRHFY